MSLFVWLNEAETPELKADYAMVIEELLKQRIKGIKNDQGAWIAPTFPKILYTLSENNITPDGEYFYLTKLAAECTTKRMVPDYISEKKMRELKEDNVYGCMGAVTSESRVYWKLNGKAHQGSIEKMYHSVIDRYDVEEESQFGQQGNPNKDINLKDFDVEIYDNGAGKYVKCLMMNKNLASQFRMYKIRTYNPIDNRDVNLVVTHDHPMMKLKSEFDPKLVTIDWNNPDDVSSKCEEVQAENLKTGDYVFFTEEKRCIKTGEIVDQTIPTPVQILITPISNDYKYVYDVTTESEHFMVNNLWSHNCRSFLAPWKDPETGEYKFWGRLNTGVVTINLPHVALEMKEENPNWDMHNPEDVKAFYEKFDRYLEYCHRALLEGHKWLEGTKASVSPILWQHGALARLKPNETIDSKIFNGYSSSSLGYVGLHETLMALTGKSHTASEENKQFALNIAKHMNLKCQEWNNIPGQNHGFSLYGTPEESTTYKFSKSLRKLHGVVKGITDKNYITNSYHWPVTEGLEDGVTPFVKLGFESEFQQYTTGGAISYVEAPNMVNNIEAVITVMRFIYDHIMYAELNCKLDYCHTCGGYGTIEMIKNKDGKFIWKCHNCGEEDPENIDVSVRVCGYISSANAINQGRMEEINSRKKHM